MADRVHRVTMFKLPSAEDRQALLAAYKILETTQAKDGKPYILSVVVGQPEENPRSQGYTLACKTEFASMEDMKYYDDECPAHGKLKGIVANELGVEGILTVFFKPDIVGGNDLA